MRIATIFLVCAFALATHAKYIVHQEKARRELDLNLIEEAKELLEELNKAVDDGIQEGVGTLKKLYAEMLGSITSEQKEASDSQKDNIQILMDNIDKLMEEARNINDQAVQCVKAAQIKALILDDQTSMWIRECGDGAIGMTLDLIDEAISTIENTHSKVVSFENRVRDCGNDTDCLIRVIDELRENLVELPKQIENVVTNTITSSEEINEFFDGCIANAQGYFELNGGECNAEAEACVRVTI